MNAKLMDAIEVFKQLGWQHVTKENVLTLPLGDAQQQKTAREGLKSGEWGKFQQIGENRYGYVKYHDVNEAHLALFAVRQGVNAQRAAGLLSTQEPEMTFDVIVQRGEKFAVDFIRFACVSRNSVWEHSTSVFGNVAVRLVEALNLEIPNQVQYLKDWAAFAANAMGKKAEIRRHEKNILELAFIEKRFYEHVVAAVAAGVPATGPFGEVFPEGVKKGLIDRENAINLAFSALDAAARPGDRKIWLSIILDELKVDKNEILQRSQFLIPILSQGDSVLIERMGTMLIETADDDLLESVLVACCCATTKKTKLLILRAALLRNCPSSTDDISMWLQIFAADKDKNIASLAKRLISHWNLAAQLPQQQEETQEILHLWQDTPPVWTCPSFTLGEVSSQALTDLAAQLSRQETVVHDVTTERFLALACALAWQQPEQVRTALQGIKRGINHLLDTFHYWMHEGRLPYAADSENKNGDITYRPVLYARDYEICCALGNVPCVLSMPSFDDLSVTVSDLVNRLDTYQKEGKAALEADLLLSLSRLDTETATQELRQQLKTLEIPVLLQSGQMMAEHAGKLVLAYLDSPIKSPQLELSDYRHWHCNKEKFDFSSLSAFPPRLIESYGNKYFAIFPSWGDAALTQVYWTDEVYHHKGLVLRQIARRRKPLPPGASINFLAAQRSSTPQAADDAALSVIEVWQRGLLRPGVADISFLDWSAKPPSNLALLSAALFAIAQDGLLSVVWPILDALVQQSLNEIRLLSGTAEILDVMHALLQEVEYAVAQGKTGKDALLLPAVRSLAKKNGSSKAVTLAKEIEKRLPVIDAISVQPIKPAEIKPSFDEIWLERKQAKPILDDKINITAVDWANVSGSAKIFSFTLSLPDEDQFECLFICRGWFYSIEREGQMEAYLVPKGTTNYTPNEEDKVWLHWDNEKSAVVVCKFRNWTQGKKGPLSDTKATPLSKAMLTLIIGLISQDGDGIYSLREINCKLAENGVISSLAVKQAMQVLLQFPIISPAKLVRILEKKPTLLSTHWPMVTQSISFAAETVAKGQAVPVWLNRVLDIALRNAPYLWHATKEGLISRQDACWENLSILANAKKKTAATEKANQLLTQFEQYDTAAPL